MVLCLKSSCKIRTKRFTPDFVTIWEEISRLLFWRARSGLWKYRQTSFNTQTIVSFIDWFSDVLLIPLCIVRV